MSAKVSLINSNLMVNYWQLDWLFNYFFQTDIKENITKFHNTGPWYTEIHQQSVIPLEKGQ